MSERKRSRSSKTSSANPEFSLDWLNVALIVIWFCLTFAPVGGWPKVGVLCLLGVAVALWDWHTMKSLEPHHRQYAHSFIGSLSSQITEVVVLAMVVGQLYCYPLPVSMYLYPFLYWVTLRFLRTYIHEQNLVRSIFRTASIAQ